MKKSVRKAHITVPSYRSTADVFGCLSAEPFIRMLLLLRKSELLHIAQTVGIPNGLFMSEIEHTLPGQDQAWSENCEFFNSLTPKIHDRAEAASWTQQSYAQVTGYLVGVAVGRLGVQLADARGVR
jgi:hypothetical protein